MGGNKLHPMLVQTKAIGAFPLGLIKHQEPWLYGSIVEPINVHRPDMYDRAAAHWVRRQLLRGEPPLILSVIGAIMLCSLITTACQLRLLFDDMTNEFDAAARSGISSRTCPPGGCPMKFSLFFELQIASPTAASERQAFHDCLAQAVLADELGYQGIWAVEHHGLYEYSHCSAPEVLLAYIAARTSRLLLGHAVTLTPHRYNHPIRVAERVATLDILSNGRVRWGSGKSASRTEQTAFEINPTDLDGQWQEAVEMIPRMWRSELFEWKGRFYDVPPTPILPKPVQSPHPPIFAACSRPETVVRAGSLGLGSLNFASGSDDLLHQKVKLYRQAIANASTTSRRTNNHFCSTPTSLVLKDDRKACEYGFRGSRFFGESLATYFFSPTRVVGPLDVSRDPLSSQQLSEHMANRSRSGSALTAVIGDPVSARESVTRFRQAGVDELILVMQMGTVPHEIVMESIRTFAESVMPHFT
jgi:alkanesulfonate monooxygenase SsuD/methylene tetrahydromethanopterin reductase-like flavin-dependent oxidoreductase (luciferase family)